MFVLAAALGIGTTAVLLGSAPLGDFRGVALLIAGILLIYGYAILIYRGFLKLSPLQNGPIACESKAEFRYHVYLLFYLVLFQPLTRSLLIPVPLMRVIYLALGAKLGKNSYSAGTILDPPLTYIGDNCIIGHDALLFSHAVEGDRLSLAEIRIGSNVTIGANAVIQPGVVIEDGAIIAVNAVVSKGTHVGAREVWGGTPARRIQRSDDDTAMPETS